LAYVFYRSYGSHSKRCPFVLSTPFRFPPSPSRADQFVSARQHIPVSAVPHSRDVNPFFFFFCHPLPRRGPCRRFRPYVPIPSPLHPRIVCLKYLLPLREAAGSYRPPCRTKWCLFVVPLLPATVVFSFPWVCWRGEDGGSQMTEGRRQHFAALTFFIPHF
jgi:hypothetical protein